MIKSMAEKVPAGGVLIAAATEALVGEMAEDRPCTKEPAIPAAGPVKCHFGQAAIGLFSAEIALAKKNQADQCGLNEERANGRAMTTKKNLTRSAPLAAMTAKCRFDRLMEDQCIAIIVSIKAEAAETIETTNAARPAPKARLTTNSNLICSIQNSTKS